MASLPELPVVDLSVFLSAADVADPAVQDACRQVADSLRATGALLVRDPRVAAEDNSRFLDLLEQYFGQSHDAKLEDVRARRMLDTRVRTVLGAVFPGAGAFLDSRILVAAAAFAPFAFGLLAAFLGPRLAVLPRPGLTSGTPVFVFWCAVAAAGWLGGAFISPRKV